MILNIEKFKAQLGGVQAAMKFEAAMPFIKIAEREFRTIVGVELYDFLNEADFTEAPELDQVKLEELLEITRGCIAWAAYDLALPQMKVRVGDIGMAKNAPANTVAISKWEYVDTRESNLAMSDMLWEMFWECLEDTKPEPWTSSAAYIRRNEYFLRSADELTDYISLVGRNRRFFTQLEKFIRRSEQLYICETITQGVFDNLKMRWKDKSVVLTPFESVLVEKIREALAYLTLHEAYPYLPIKIDENGLREVRKWDGIANETTADAKNRNAQRIQLWQDAQLYLGKLTDFMNKNSTPSQFPDYYLANMTTAPEPEEDFTCKSHVLI